ncbi:MAG: sulfotransferase family 2 domain-containing protein [Verrucomicrobiota bacterium]
MLIDENQKFVFVHVHKTAGLSLEQVLQRRFPTAKTHHSRHLHARLVIREVGRERWDACYRFAFVRNPWDRLVSWYSMILEAKKKLKFFQRFSRHPFPNEIWNYAVRNSRDFESFLTNCTAVINDHGCDKSFAYNQLDYLTDDDGKLAVNFVGRFENLAADVDVVFRQLGIPEEKLPRINSSKHTHYSEWYNPRTRDLVAERFARDIETFGYRFEAGK